MKISFDISIDDWIAFQKYYLEGAGYVKMVASTAMPLIRQSVKIGAKRVRSW